jgi:carboxyl-terminal processing protease
MVKKKERLFLIAILITVSLFFIIEKRFLPGITSRLSPYKSFELLGNVVGLIKRNYVEEVNPEKTMKGALKGLTDSLDILSSYLDKENAEKYSKQKNATLKDTGIIISQKLGSLPLVIGVIENSPAEKQGIEIGDTLSALDNRSTSTMSLAEVKLHLKDVDDRPVKLRILRGFGTREVNIERRLLFDRPFSFSEVKKASGILKINYLYPPCVEMIQKDLLLTLKSSRKALILDLRNCHEGGIDEALKLINLFLKTDNVGTIEKKQGEKIILSSLEDAFLEKLPLAIWVNQATIGAAEVVAAVLQEIRQAKIIGIHTIGLAAKQELFPLEDGSALLLTTGIFRLKSGKKLWEKGVKPDFQLDLDNQSHSSYLKKTLDILPRM